MNADHLASPDPWSDADWVRRTQLMLNSYQKFVGRELLNRSDAVSDARRLFEAPFVVVAHGTQDDPLLNYGNQAALELWKLTLDELIGMPSRKTAEPMHRDERAELLRRTREFGYIDDYTGIRIASTGDRFRIHRATVWNVVDEQNRYVGQAAAFADWTMLET
ncbi:MAG: MEKHLA domain-containing protein [Fuerstiella sp.]